MKKVIIIGVAAALLLTASPAFAKDGGKGKSEESHGNGRGSSSKVVSRNFDASTSAQFSSLQQQISDLNKQLAALKTSARIGGATIHREDGDDDFKFKGNENGLKVCQKFVSDHRHWKWMKNGKRFGWSRVLDQNIPQKCKGLPGFGSTTPPVVDTTAPIISGIAVSNIGSTSATVNWTTNEAATSKIFISTTSPVLTTGTPAWTDGATTTAHGVQLVGLLPNTTYYFVVTNTDAANNTRTSTQGSFVTTNGADVIAPVISSITVGSITTTGATVLWNTNELATSKIFLSTSSPVGTSSATFTDATLLSGHSAPLTGLLPNTTYNFVIEARDSSLNEAFSVQGAFTTLALDTTAPVISALSAAPTGTTTGTVSWTTNEAADSTVYFSTTSPVVIGTAQSVTNASLITSHSMNLIGLTASTTYFMIVGSKDGSNNLATSSQISFTTN